MAITIRSIGDRAQQACDSARSELIRQRVIGAQIMAHRFVAAMSRHDQARRRPETTTAREIAQREYARFTLQCEAQGCMPDPAQVRECCWLSAAMAIGFAVGALFTKYFS